MTYGEQHKHTAPYPVPVGREGEQACAGADPDVFFPDSGFAADHHETVRALCRSCPFAAPCLVYALDRADLHGIWAGTTTAERAELRRQRRRAA